MQDMSHSQHDGHDDHRHGEDCGHQTIDHEGHVDYLHAGHAHAEHEQHWDEHPLSGPGGADGGDRTSWTTGGSDG